MWNIKSYIRDEFIDVNTTVNKIMRLEYLLMKINKKRKNTLTNYCTCGKVK